MESNVLSFLIGLPAICAAVILLKSPQAKWARLIALSAAIIAGVMGLASILALNPALITLQLKQQYPWIRWYSIEYFVGLDGFMSVPLLLVLCVFPLVIAALSESRNSSGVFAALLFLESFLLGALLSQDAFLLLFFWTLCALPPFFLGSLWGVEGKEEASSSHVIMVALSHAAVFMLAVILYYSTPEFGFSLEKLAAANLDEKVLVFMGKNIALGKLVFFLLLMVFLLRLPLWPFSRWFERMVESGHGGGVAVYFGAVVPVGFLLLVKLSYLIIPKTTFQMGWLICALGLINGLFGAMGSISHDRARGFLAHSGMASFALLFLGMGSGSSVGLMGMSLHAFVLGLTYTAFCLIFFGMENLGVLPQKIPTASMGLAWRSPRLAALFAGIILSLSAAPFTGGFISTLMVSQGLFGRQPSYVVLALVFFIVLSVGHFRLFRIYFLGGGGPGGKEEQMDLEVREFVVVTAMLLGVIFLGFYPKPLMELVQGGVEYMSRVAH